MQAANDEEKFTRECRCMACGYEWKVDSLAGEILYPCPRCKTIKGVCKKFVVPDADTATWACRACESYLWTIYAIGGDPVLMCCECGSLVNALDIFPERIPGGNDK